MNAGPSATPSWSQQSLSPHDILLQLVPLPRVTCVAGQIAMLVCCPERTVRQRAADRLSFRGSLLITVIAIEWRKQWQAIGYPSNYQPTGDSWGLRRGR